MKVLTSLIFLLVALTVTQVSSKAIKKKQLIPVTQVMYLLTYVYKKQKGMSKMLKKNKSWINIKRFYSLEINWWFGGIMSKR